MKKKEVTAESVKGPAVPGRSAPLAWFYLQSGFVLGDKKGSASDFGIECQAPWHITFGIGLSGVVHGYDASGYDIENNKPCVLKSQSLVRNLFTKFPLTWKGGLGKDMHYSIGVAPTLLIRTENDDKLFTFQSFNRWNCTYFCNLVKPLHGKKRWLQGYSIGVWFSGDAFSNLKHDEVRDKTGQILYKQVSRTYQAGINLLYVYGMVNALE
ncbi:MAG: hypothetical protein ACHQRM_08615 [Bacteroidia bacterium]